MPRMKLASGHTRSIEVIVPLKTLDMADTCSICSARYCFHDDRCSKTATVLSCCQQSLCSGCLTKLSRRCRCTLDCTAIIAHCPFCRDIASISAMDMFLGSSSGEGCCECADDD